LTPKKEKRKSGKRGSKDQKKLRKLGEILGVSSQKNLIVRIQSQNIPRVNSKVFDRKRRKIGFVFDIIGPVSAPYAVVKCELPPEEIKGDIYVWG